MPESIRVRREPGRSHNSLHPRAHGQASEVGGVPPNQTAAVGFDPTSSCCTVHWLLWAGLSQSLVEHNLHKRETVPGPTLSLRTGGSESKSCQPASQPAVEAPEHHCVQTLPHLEASDISSIRTMCTRERIHTALLHSSAWRKGKARGQGLLLSYCQA